MVQQDYFNMKHLVFFIIISIITGQCSCNCDCDDEDVEITDCSNGADNDRCLMSRLDHYECEFCNMEDKEKSSVGENQYNWHRTKFTDMECKMSGRLGAPAENIGAVEGTNALVLTSPRHELNKYKSRWYAQYRVNCPDLIYFNIFELDTRGRDCPDGECCRCRDYIIIDPDGQKDGFGTFEECGSTSCQHDDRYLGQGELAVIFRTSEESNVGETWVKKPSDDSTIDYYKGFQMYTICFKQEHCPVLKNPRNGRVMVTGFSEGDTATYECHCGFVLDNESNKVQTCQENREWSNQTPKCIPISSRRKRYAGGITENTWSESSTLPRNEKMESECGIEKSSTSYKSLFPTVYTTNLRMAKDLAKFHEQWQRMSIQPGAELTIEYILYNQTITYMDSTIFILDPQNRIVAQHNQVNFMKTFDSTGTTNYYIHEVRGRTPHFTGPGPLVIVCNCAFFQMFVIDPRGLVPNKTELEIMYKPFRNLFASYNGYSGSGSGIGRDGLQDATDPPTKISFTDIERKAVIAAHRNKAACNPVLRAQSNATIHYFSRINVTLVECLDDYLSCSLRFDRHFIPQLTCTSKCNIFPVNTTCQLNDGPIDVCDPFSGAVQFQGSAVMGVHTNLTVNTTSGFDYSAKVVLCLQLP